MVDGQLARVVEDEPRPILELLRDEDLVSVESDLRTQVAELGKELQIESREIIIFVHRKFIIVAFRW
jgi:hypothetical protein